MFIYTSESRTTNKKGNFLSSTGFLSVLSLIVGNLYTLIRNSGTFLLPAADAESHFTHCYIISWSRELVSACSIIQRQLKGIKFYSFSEMSKSV